MPARNRDAALAVAALAFVAYQLQHFASLHVMFGDYRAFYCGASALLHARDPYAGSSLYACERAMHGLALYRVQPGLVVPAPLPGYALAMFAPLALLPFGISSALWLAVLLAACAYACVLLARLISLPLAAGIAVFAAGFAAGVLPYGQISCIVIAALIFTAIALRRGAWNAAACSAAVAMIHPHVAAPALIAVFLAKKEMRLRLLAAVCVLAILDFAAGGPATALKYVTSVLPAHSFSEIGDTNQYALTWVLHAFGFPDRAAVFGGDCSYVVMLLAGVACACALAARYRDPAFAVLIAPAFAVFGGTFIHYSEVLTAIPAGALLFAYANEQKRAWVLAGLMLIACPWSLVLLETPLVVPFAFTCAAIVWTIGQRPGDAALRAALEWLAFMAVLLAAGIHFGPAMHGGAVAKIVSPHLAESVWSAWVRAQASSVGAIWWIAKMPTWAGLGILTIGCAHAAAARFSRRLVTSTQ